MRRMIPALACVVLSAAACGSDAGSGGTSSSASPMSPVASGSPSISASVSPSLPASPTAPAPSPSPDLHLPADAPTAIDDPAAVVRIESGDLTPLAPPGATVTFTSTWTMDDGDAIDQIAFSWRRGEDPFALANGFEVWQPDDGGWRVVYAFTDGPAKQVFGVRVDGTGDLTGDGLDDILTFEDMGGSGACGAYRVIGSAPGSASELFRRETCDARIEIVDEALRLQEAVYEPDDSHCCPSSFRVTTLEWDGRRFVPASSRTIPA